MSTKQLWNLACLVVALVMVNVMIVVCCGYSTRGQTGRTTRHGFQ